MLDKDAPDLRPIELPRQARSYSFRKSAACTIATFAKRPSPVSSVLWTTERTRHRSAATCPLSLVYRESAGTTPGRQRENAERRTSNLAYAFEARISESPGESEEVLAKDR